MSKIPPVAPTTPSAEHLALVQDVLGRRYELYSWCEEKINTLSTVNSILLGVILALTGQVFKPETPLAITTLVTCALAVLASLIVVLWHIVPTMRSGASPKTEKNLRSVVGISRYATREEYIDALLASQPDDLFRATAFQVYGMNKNVMKNQRAIKFAVIADLVGLGLYVLSAIASVFHW